MELGLKTEVVNQLALRQEDYSDYPDGVNETTKVLSGGRAMQKRESQRDGNRTQSNVATVGQEPKKGGHLPKAAKGKGTYSPLQEECSPADTSHLAP